MPLTPDTRQTAWLYSGIWAVLTRLFLVPREPPTMPSGAHDIVGTFRPSPGYLRYVKTFFWISFLSLNIFLVIGWIGITVASLLAGVILGILALAIIIAQGVFGYIGIYLRYDSTWYVLTDRSMRLRRGLLHITETTITYENVQNVTVNQGPAQRLFGIADVMVHTAGGSSHAQHGKGGGPDHLGRIEGVENANHIRDLIMTRVRASRSAGLGDEDRSLESAPGTHTSAFAAPGWNASHLATLRQIRDLLPAAK